MFHCHRVPDAFQLVLDSWKFVIEVHCTVRAPLVFCSISGVFSSGRRGMGRFSWALQDPAGNHPPWMVWNHMGCPSCIPVFSYVSRYRFGSCFLVDDGSYWSTMVSGGLDLILQCWSAGTSCAPRFRPWVAVKTSGEPDEPPLRWSFFIISSMFFGLEFTQVGVHGTIEWFGLPRSRHLSLRRSVHDAGFVCDR